MSDREFEKLFDKYLQELFEEDRELLNQIADRF
jgi:hypothetical protein